MINASSWNGLNSSVTESTDDTNNIIESQGKFWSKTSNDGGLDGYPRPYYNNGYWHVITYDGMVYRIKHDRLVS